MPSCSMACRPQLRLPARRPDRTAAGSVAFVRRRRRYTGRRTSLTRGNGAVTSWSYVASSRNWSLTQNLTGTANDVTLGFVFNPAGQAITRTTTNTAYNFTPASSLSQAYTRDGLNRYTAVGGTSQTYDARGNLTGDGSRTYGYDLENRLTSISSPGLTLSYDPLGRLRAVTTGGVTTSWLWDGDRLVAEYDGAGTLTARYAHGPGPDEPLADWLGTTNATRLWFHADHQNTTIALSDGTGTISGTVFTYSPYGEPAGGIYSGPRFRFTGQSSLPGTPPLWHYKARAYAPGIGRFLQTDPVGYEDSLNLYAYVANDPVNGTDPTGMIQDPESDPPPACDPADPDCPIDLEEVVVTAIRRAGAVVPTNVRQDLTALLNIRWRDLACAAPTVGGNAGVDAYAGLGGSVTGGASMNPANGQISLSVDVGIGVGVGVAGRARGTTNATFGSPSGPLPIASASVNANANATLGLISGGVSRQLISKSRGETNYSLGVGGGATVNANVSGNGQINLPPIWSGLCY